MPAVTLRSLPSLEAAREPWEALERRSRNPFTSWTFASAWWRQLGAGRPLRLQSAHTDDGRLAALLPLFVADDGDPPTLQLIGHWDADLLGPICAPGDLRFGLAALREAALRERARLVADSLPAGSAAALGGVVERSYASPVLDVPPGGFEELLASKRAHRRTQLRARAERFELRAADASTLEADLETLLELHRARWGEASWAFEGPREQLHREFAAEALRSGWLRLRLLEDDGIPVAASYAFRVGAGEWLWQTGRDPGRERDSVGSTLQLLALRAAIEEGVGTYRWLRGGERYKRRWANRDEPVERVVIEPDGVGSARPAAARQTGD